MHEIRWREWNDAAFEESRKSGKPVLLDISAVWCHWCHVMDETTYSDPAVVDLINEHFIPIRVDNDRNPDLNSRYNMGGWPTTAFLTYNRDVITGATYVPPDQMIVILQRISSAYAEQGEELVKKAGAVEESIEDELDEVKPGTVSIGQVNVVLEAIKSSYDPQFGGFGFDQKFPFTDVLDFLLFHYETTGNHESLQIVSNTLHAMIDGEIFDKVEGGMFRYTTRRDWTVPHYEKMLGDNASISSVLLDAYRLTQNHEFLNTALKIFSYLESILRDPINGAYFGSQDADEEYYKRDAVGRAELQQPGVDTAVYTDSNANLAMSYLKLWGVNNNASARDKALDIVDFLNRLPRADDGTACHYFDDSIAHQLGNLSDQTCLSLVNILCYEVTGRKVYLNTAKDLVDTMLRVFRLESGSLSDITESHAAKRGLSRHSMPLSENVVAAICLIKLSNITDDTSYISSAREILNAFANIYAEHGILAASYAAAVILLSIDPVLITVNAKEDSPQKDDLIQAAIHSCGYRCDIKNISQDEDGQPSATVCLGSVCRARVTTPTELSTELAEVIHSI